jgi:hypothetical protein
MSPSTVLHYRQRADSFLRAAGDLATLDPGNYAPAIGLLSVHSCIALADAVLVAVEGRWTKAEDHAEAARRLREWCGAKRLADSGLKHFEWLLGRKNHFSYNDDIVKDEDLLLAKVKMEQFFAWAFQTFPAVAQIREASHA